MSATATLTATMDQLQAELDDMRREVTVLGYGLIALSVCLLIVCAIK
jgi:hypothetical protein